MTRRLNKPLANTKFYKVMNKKSDLDCFLYFMWNKWDEEECMNIFGESLGKHIWSKWVDHCEGVGRTGAAATMYAVLDSDKRRKIVERAVAYYSK